MAVTRREMLNQLQSMIDAERKVMAATGSISSEEIDSAGFIEEAEDCDSLLNTYACRFLKISNNSLIMNKSVKIHNAM